MVFVLFVLFVYWLFYLPMSLDGVKQLVLNTSSTSKSMKLSLNVSLTHLERIKGGIYCYDLTMALRL